MAYIVTYFLSILSLQKQGVGLGDDLLEGSSASDKLRVVDVAECARG